MKKFFLALGLASRQKERGFSLLEIAIALPLIALLLFSLGRLLFSGLTAYRHLLFGQELVSEVRISLAKIVRDLSYAEKVNVIDEKTLRVYTRYNSESPAWVTYQLTRDSLGLYGYITRNTQPLTDPATHSSHINIDRFHCRLIGDKTVVLHIIGRQLDTQETYSLHTAVTCQSIR